MEPTFRLRLLGTVQVEQDGQPVRGFGSRKALALLGYLAVHDHPIPREHLVDLLWENQSEARGRANLSWVLHKISALLPGCLEADRHSVQFRRGDSYWLDTDTFEGLRAQDQATSLAAAVALYRGEFLEGLYLHACAEFEIWLVGERERWRQRVAGVLGDLVTHHGQRGEYRPGLHFARRLLALEPWREETHRQVMRLLAYSGQRTAALAQYETCRRVLAAELGVEPVAQTTRLYHQIRDGNLSEAAWEQGSRGELSTAPPLPLSPSPLLPLSPSTPFVARERELAQLEGFLSRALAGQGRVVFVTGDAGQGKTALLQECARRAQAAQPDLLVAGGNGNAHTGIGDPYLPFREILGLLTGDVETRRAAGAIPAEQARRLWQALPLAAQALVETGPDLIDLFVPGLVLAERATASAPAGADWLPPLKMLVERQAARPGTSHPQQRALFEQYTQVLQALARQRPLLLLLDDLQWADSGSASLLFHLGRHLAGSRILIVGAYRPQEVALGRPASSRLVGEPALSLSKGIEGGRERHPLEPVVNEFKRYLGDVEIDLERVEGWQFVEAFLDSEPNRLGHPFREMLYRQTRGHPLFTIELLRGMQERGDLFQDGEGHWVEGPALDWDTLPPRVEAVIAERIGQLPQELQETLTMASVEGETFTAEVLARVRTAGERDVLRRLSGDLDRRYRLVSAQRVLQTGGQRLSQYRFRHILFQKYLHSNLDPVERAHLHQAVGTALEALYGKGTPEIAVQLARHFQEAGLAAKAVDTLRQAGERAARLSAHPEAIAHFTRGLELLETLPDTCECARQELALQLALGVSLQITRGYAAPEVGRTYARARELCGQVGEAAQLLPLLGLLLTFYGARGEHQAACEIGEQALDLAQRAQDPLLVALAHWQLGVERLFLGQLAQAQAHLEHMVAFYEPRQHHPLAFHYGLDPGVMSLSATSWALWVLGYPEQALARSQRALALAQASSHPPSLALAHIYACTLHAFCGDWQAVRQLAEECIRLSTEYGIPYWLAGGLACRGWALAEQGQAETGIAQIRQGLAASQTTGAEVLRVLQLAVLAEAYRRAGQAQEGLAALAEALATVDRTGERLFEAQVHRLKGDLLRMQGAQAAEVEQCYRQAMAVARAQQAKSWELRAAVSLCRLWQTQGKPQEARALLAGTYSWFTEGFDTPDLQEARALLKELSA